MKKNMRQREISSVSKDYYAVSKDYYVVKLEQQLAEARAFITELNDGSTHWDGCESVHPWCRLAAILKETP